MTANLDTGELFSSEATVKPLGSFVTCTSCLSTSAWLARVAAWAENHLLEALNKAGLINVETDIFLSSDAPDSFNRTTWQKWQMQYTRTVNVQYYIQ